MAAVTDIRGSTERQGKALMLQEVALAIAVLGPEGLCADALAAADVVVADPCAGLDLLLRPARLVATLHP